MSFYGLLKVIQIFLILKKIRFVFGTNGLADENGDLGTCIRSQWRRWKNHLGEEIDQLSELIDQIKNESKFKTINFECMEVKPAQ